MRKTAFTSLLSGDVLVKLQSLGLSEVTHILEEVQNQSAWIDMSFTEKLEYIITRVHQIKSSERIARLKRAAKLRIPNASLSGLTYTDKRQLNRSMMLELGSTHFLKDATNIIIEGPTGSGKTHIACAIANACLEHDLKTCYIRFPDLILSHEECSENIAAKRRLINRLSSYPILVIDEWLMSKVSVKTQDILFEIIERRHTDFSTIFCSQYSLDNWHEKLGGNTKADSIMDRIIHNKLVIQLGNENMRKLKQTEKIK